MDKRLARKQTTTVTGLPLPVDLVEGAVVRLRWLAVGFAVCLLSVYLTGKYLPSSWINPDLAPDSYRLSIFAAITLSIAMFSLTYRKSLSPYLLLDYALLYEVAGGLMVAIAESAVPRAEGEFIRGHSSVAVWIAFFVLAVPSSFGKAALAAVATACMGPIGLAYQVIRGNVETPPAADWLLPFGSSFLMAIGAALLSRLIYHLGAQITHAREMGSYELVELLGAGGMGEVWRAQHRMLAREAAIKLIRPEVLHPGHADSARSRFEREAQAIASLHSPHTVTLYDYGVTDDGQFYYVMELLSGLNLEKLIEMHGPMPAGRAAAVLLQICDSLSEAHDSGLIHRDIKPGNILLCRVGSKYDFAKVLDFGLVKHTDGEFSQLTADGTTTGTPAFLSPEAAAGERELDARADIYSLGCVAYWLVTGRLVFVHNTPVAIILAHLKESPEPPSTVTDNRISHELEKIILDCLEKDPAKRPQTVHEVADRIHALGHLGWDVRDAEEWWKSHYPDKS